MPSSSAFSVIRAVKRASVPPICSAMATAMSLAERTAVACMASSSVIVCPAAKPSLDGGCEAARGETVITSSSLARPSDRASNAM